MADLTAKQLAWANAYLETSNKTEAARRAGYDGNDVTLASIGYENFRKPQIEAYLKQRLSEKAMPADEVLTRLADMARSDIADFAHVEDWSSLTKLPGKSHVIKKFKRKVTTGKDDTRYEEIELELYDAQAALVHIGRVHNLFKETHTNLNYDLSKATDEQLQRIAAGDDPAAVLQQNPTTSGG